MLIGWKWMTEESSGILFLRAPVVARAHSNRHFLVAEVSRRTVLSTLTSELGADRASCIVLRFNFLSAAAIACCTPRLFLRSLYKLSDRTQALSSHVMASPSAIYCSGSLYRRCGQILPAVTFTFKSVGAPCLP